MYVEQAMRFYLVEILSRAVLSSLEEIIFGSLIAFAWKENLMTSACSSNPEYTILWMKIRCLTKSSGLEIHISVWHSINSVIKI